MNDLISRQDAIDLFPNDNLEWDTFYGYIAPHFARRMLKELQSPQVEPVRYGRWKFVSIGRYVCSLCGFEPYYEGNISTLNYCPYCGARMKEENGTD